MLTRMNDNIFRWWTPDPEEENLMAGHLVTTSDGFVLIDPPVVPGLGDFLERFGRAHAIILTTHDHTRGSRYLSDRFGAPILVPEQADEARLAQGRVVPAGAYRDGQTLPGGITARRVPVWVDQSLYLDEMLLIRGDAALLGDVASGWLDGSIECCPEQFVPSPALAKVAASCRALRESVPTDVQLLLPGHNYPISGDWQHRSMKKSAAPHSGVGEASRQRIA